MVDGSGLFGFQGLFVGAQNPLSYGKEFMGCSRVGIDTTRNARKDSSSVETSNVCLVLLVS